MREIAVVTTYNREELLYLSLEAIRIDDPYIDLVVFSDRGAVSEDLHTVCHLWQAQLVVREQHPYYGNSYNLLTAAKYAAFCSGMGIVHLIEDDTIIHPGYFEWARKVLNLVTVDYAVACGRIQANFIANWYEAPCASWNAEDLRTALQHLHPGYFDARREAMQLVLDNVMFPNSKYKKGGAEQDGFFLRCIEQHHWNTIFAVPAAPNPDSPNRCLASHIGWWGYNQPSGRARPAGSLTERIEACRKVLRSKEERSKYFGHVIAAKEMEGMR